MTQEIHYIDAPIEWRDNISGWVGPNGRFYGPDEHAARYDSCTHRTCSTDGCGSVTLKHYTHCDRCREIACCRNHRAATTRPIDATDEMYYSDKHDRYFQSWDEVEEWCEENGCRPDGLRLYHCEREAAPQVDVHDLYDGITPDELGIDEMITDEIEQAVNDLNKLLASHPVNCFIPTKIAVEIPQEEER